MQIKPTNTPEDLVLQAIEDCRKKHVWGQLQVDFRNGNPVVLRVSETTIINEHEEENKSHNGNRN